MAGSNDERGNILPFSDRGISRYKHLCSMGSSFAAGPSLDPVADAFARRSKANYSAQLAKALGARHTDLTVSGATFANLLDTKQRVVHLSKFGFVHSIPPQTSCIPSDADLITITAGGNDLGYSKVTLMNALSGWLYGLSAFVSPLAYLASSEIPKGTEEEIEKTVQGLVNVVEAVRRKAAPNARILLVDYLAVFGPDTVFHPIMNPLSAEQIASLRQLGKKLDSAFVKAAERTGVKLVKISEISESHAIGSREPWVNAYIGTITGQGAGAAYHPNAAGMQAVAKEIYRILQQN